jgi:hypothetical protein
VILKRSASIKCASVKILSCNNNFGNRHGTFGSIGTEAGTLGTLLQRCSGCSAGTFRVPRNKAGTGVEEVPPVPVERSES